jgi:hypothetical protein
MIMRIIINRWLTFVTKAYVTLGEKSPFVAIILFSSLLLFLTGIATIAALTRHAIALNETQIMYLFSTSAQVIAAIYGLTLTGFIFLRNELSREEREDETLSEPIDKLKSRYFVLLVFVTILVGYTLLLSNLEISLEASGGDLSNKIIINAGSSAFVVCLIVIAYFIFDVTSPMRIMRASMALQSEVDPLVAERTKGSLENFLKNYNEIERILKNVGEPYQNINANLKPHQRRISNSRMAEILLQNERIDLDLYTNLKNLITLRNSIIHGANPIISQKMVDASSDVMQELKTTLKIN